MSQRKEETRVVKDYESIEETMYYIIKYRGKGKLIDYLLKIKWKSIKFIEGRESTYLPIYLKPYVEKFNRDLGKRNLILTEFKEKITNNALSSINTDFTKIQNNLSQNLANIHILFIDYFLKKLEYLKESQLFELQITTVKDLISHLSRNITSEKQQEIRELQDKKRKREKEEKERKAEERKQARKEKREFEEEKKSEREIIYYEIKSKDLLSKNLIPSGFELYFTLLNDYSENEIKFSDIENIEEKDIESKLNNFRREMRETEDEKKLRRIKSDYENLREKYEEYHKRKREITTKQYRRKLSRLSEKIEKDAMKYTKKIIKEIYEYEEDSIVDYKERKGLFG